MKTALVTGANRGIGFEICRQLLAKDLRVVLTARDSKLGFDAAQTLRDKGADIRFQHLDIAKPASVSECAEALKKDDVQVDVLINNGAIMPGGTMLTIELETFQETMAINVYGAFLMIKAFVPSMVERKYGRVVNISSGSGSFDESLHGPAAYSISKVTLNAVTVKLAEVVPHYVKVNSMCPGWVRTRMGGDGAPLTLRQGADTAVWLATLDEDGPSGGFFRDRKPIPW